MRRQVAVRILGSAAAAACVWAAIVAAQSALAGLGVSDETGRRMVDEWVRTGFINATPAAKAVKAAAPAQRAVLIRNAMAWAKTYTESPAFKAEYDRQRKDYKPSPPEVKGTVDDELARQSAERKQGVEDMKKNLAQMPAEVRKSLEESIKQAEESNRKMDTDPQMVAMMRQMIEAQRAGEQKTFQERTAAYEQRWPADSKALVARRLQEFLDITKDVDFEAKLVAAGTKMRFAEPRYEEKPPTWKLCFRMGREAGTAAREAAQAWLKAIS